MGLTQSYSGLLMVKILFLLLLPFAVYADRTPPNITVTPEVTVNPEVTVTPNVTVEVFPEFIVPEVQERSAPVSKSNLEENTTAAIAAGSHQFDYSTTDYQLSLTNAFQSSGPYNFSIGIAKRFNQSSAPNVLFHGSYTPNSSGDYFGAGGTIRF